MTSANRSRSKSALLGRILACLLAFGLLASAVFAEDLAETRKKAEQGEAEAQFGLGVMYDNGIGVPKDEVEAVKWYRKAAERGNANAQYNLGVMYDNGTGVPKDLVQAHMWWNIAGAKGNEVAKNNLAIAEKQMTAEQKEKATDLARELFARLEKK